MVVRFFILKLIKQNANKANPINVLIKTLARASPKTPIDGINPTPKTKIQFTAIFKNIPIIAIKFGKNTIS